MLLQELENEVDRGEQNSAPATTSSTGHDYSFVIALSTIEFSYVASEGRMRKNGSRERSLKVGSQGSSRVSFAHWMAFDRADWLSEGLLPSCLP